MDKRALDIDRPILITGAARSGTSMIAGVVHLCGAWGGKMTGPTKYNKKGQFENSEIRNNITKPYLKSMGYDPMGQRPLPDIHNLKPIDLKTTVTDVIKRQGYQGGPWFYKGAKMCLFWPKWHEAFPRAKWVIVRRKSEDIANSCLRTSFMRAYNTVSGWLQWVAVHEKRFKEMHEAGLDIKEVWPIKAIKGDFNELETMISWLGLDYHEEVVKSFVTPKLYHST